MSAITSIFTRIPYPNRPIGSLVIAVLFYLPCLIPFLPFWLHYFCISTAFGMVIDDILSWPVVQIVNLPYVYATKQKWLKNALQIMSILIGAYLGFNLIFSGYAPYVGFIDLLLGIVRRDYILGMVPFAFTTVLSIVVLHWCDKRHMDGKIGNFSCIIFGMCIAQLANAYVLPYLISPFSLHVDALFCGTMVGMFSVSLGTKLVAKIIYYILLGHSNSDGQCFMNKDHWLSKKIGLREWLYQRQLNKVQSHFKNGTDVKRLFEEAYAIRTRMKATKLREKLNMYQRINLVLVYDQKFKDLRNAPLKSLANIRSDDEAKKCLKFMQYFPRFEQIDGKIFYKETKIRRDEILHNLNSKDKLASQDMNVESSSDNDRQYLNPDLHQQLQAAELSISLMS